MVRQRAREEQLSLLRTPKDYNTLVTPPLGSSELTALMEPTSDKYGVEFFAKSLLTISKIKS
jgi:hypothetical protein